MVKKLYKHEFYALGRLLLPLSGICLAMAVVFSFCISLMLNSNGNPVTYIMCSITGLGFVVSVIAASVMTMVLLVIRFYSTFAKSEGYLAMSLPVDVSTHITCKLVCGFVFQAISLLILITSIGIVMLGTGVSGEVWNELAVTARNTLSIYSKGALVLTVVLTVLLLILSGFQSQLLPYAAIAMGQRSNGKLGMSIVWYFVFNAAMQIISSIASLILSFSLALEIADVSGAETAVGSTATMWLSIGLSAVFSAVLYGITRYNLKNRLNLE